jgi:hypothetical protein
MITDFEFNGFDSCTFDFASSLGGSEFIESNLEVEMQKEAPMASTSKKMRVLCLHGKYHLSKL